MSLLKRLLGYFKNHRVSLFFVILFAVISTVFTVLAPTVIGEITTELYKGVSTGTFDEQKIGLLLVILAGLYLIAQLFAFLQSFGMAKIMAKAMQTLRNDIYKKMHRTTLNFYDTRTNGEILSVITNDVDTLNNALSQNITKIVTEVITAVGILVMMLTISKWLTLIAVAMVPLSLFSVSGVIKASGKHFAKQQDLIGNMNGYIEEMYKGQSVVSVFGYHERAEKRFAELNGSLRETAAKAEIFSGVINPVTTLVNNLGYVVSAVIGCFFVLSGKMPLGSVQAMLQYTKQYSQPFTSIAGMAGSFSSAAAASKRIFELLDAEEEVPDPENGEIPNTSGGTVEFRHTAFGYTPDKLLMNDVNISVKAGQKVAIVGPTGAGKTTLINLLMRFYEISSGEILVDGVNTKNMTRAELRSHFGMVLQDTWLFEGTIRDNAITSCSDLLERFGGHKLAAGLTISADDNSFEEFRRRMNDCASSLTEDDLRPVSEWDLELDETEITDDLYAQIEALEPFGSEVPRPVVKIRVKLVEESHRFMGDHDQHVKLFAKDFSLVGFNLAQRFIELGLPQEFTAYGYLKSNCYRGKITKELSLLDLCA